MTNEERLLNEIATVEFATPANLFSYSAKMENNSTHQVMKYIKRWLGYEKPLIRKIRANEEIHNKRREQFYQLTEAGYRFIEREDESINIGYKHIENIKHESMVKDTAISFLRNYPEWEIDFDFHRTIKGKRSDIFVDMRKDGKRVNFWVECERKDDHSPQKIITRLKSVDEVMNWIWDKGFKEERIEKLTQVLVMVNNKSFNPLARPQGYEKRDVEKLNLYFSKVLDRAKNLHSARYRFLPFSEFTNIHLPLWRCPDGNVVKIIN